MTNFTSQVPPGKSVTVRIIDSTSSINALPAKALMKPDIPGFDILPELPTWSFLIEHESGRKVLFDLGVPTDWEDMAPKVSDRLKKSGWVINVKKSTISILAEQNIKPESIEAIVWSHWHWDHIGNPSTFPPSTKVIVGPGFKDELLPAYPANPDSNVRETDFEGRELQEISFNEPQSLQIGPFRALDYFGDGSLYLLDTPGHAAGHLSSLIRTTTNPDTFIFTGGDLTHHAGELRPSKLLPIPASLAAQDIPELAAKLSCATSCPGSIFEELNKSRGRTPARTEPFFDPAMGKDIPLAIETIKKTQIADGDENVLYIFAHDTKIRGITDLYPQTANDWKKQGWREKLIWRFLEDFEAAAIQAKEKVENESREGKL